MLWSLHTLLSLFSLLLQGMSEPSCALSLSSQARLSSVRDLQHWTWRLHCCFAGTGHQHVLDLAVNLTWHLLDPLHLSLHLCILHDVLVCGGILALYLCWHVNVHVLLLGLSTGSDQESAQGLGSHMTLCSQLSCGPNTKRAAHAPTPRLGIVLSCRKREIPELKTMRCSSHQRHETKVAAPEERKTKHTHTHTLFPFCGDGERVLLLKEDHHVTRIHHDARRASRSA